MTDRRVDARRIRQETAELRYSDPHPEHLSNGEENLYPSRIASFSKGLPHDDDPQSPTFGEVDSDAYATLTRALGSGDFYDFEAIQLTGSGTRKLVNPRAGLTFDLEGVDAHAVTMPPAPCIDSDVVVGEMVELYWMALLRDVELRDYANDATVAQAAADLDSLGDYGAPRPVTPESIFRGITPGDLKGPYLSQFMLHDVALGTIRFQQRQETKRSGTDYVVTPEEWVAVQNGQPRDPNPKADLDPVPRYVRNLRDLAHYVHFDQLYQAYLNACLILLDIGAPFDAGNPYRLSGTQDPFGTFGGPHVLSLVPEVATRALKAVWYQKWFVHRRLRPEAYGGLVHIQKTSPGRYPMIPNAVLQATAVKETEAAHGSYLLPQAFPEGSPVHPAYGAGHATVAGACVTILKAFFDESWVAFHGSDCKCGKDPGGLSVVVPSDGGTSLEPAPGSPCLTVGDELNKVAANIAIGRNAGGVHWRTDYTDSVKLGEAVALSVLRDQKPTYAEGASLRFTRFDGNQAIV